MVARLRQRKAELLRRFTERLDADATRQAAAQVVRRAKRNKAFDDSAFIGLAIHGATSVVGTGLSLPFDVEPYGPGDSEYSAGQRLLRRTVDNLGPRFADYVVVDGEFATAPFLHTADAVG